MRLLDIGRTVCRAPEDWRIGLILPPFPMPSRHSLRYLQGHGDTIALFKFGLAFADTGPVYLDISYVIIREVDDILMAEVKQSESREL